VRLTALFLCSFHALCAKHSQISYSAQLQHVERRSVYSTQGHAQVKWLLSAIFIKDASQ
jgi:hypothetical protein